jgi:hypothetical protein
MRLARVTWFYDFIQILNCTGKQPTKNDYFTKHIAFTIIYFL